MSKYICYLKNDFTAIRKEFLFFDVKNKVIKGSHSPYSASFFKTKKEARETIKKYYSDTGSSNNIIIDDSKELHFSEYQNWIDNGCTYRIRPIKNSDYSKPYDKEERMDVLKWWVYYLKNEDEISYSDLITWPKLGLLFCCIRDVICWFDDVNNDYLLTFSMMVKKECDFETFKNEFYSVQEYIDRKDDGFKFVDIFEHTLSEFCSYNLLYNDNVFKIMRNNREYKKFDNLEDLFDFWKSNLYY